MAMVNSFEIGTYGNYIFTNSGSTPVAGLILSGNILYGTASRGGSSDFNSSSGNGTVFAIKTNGTGFTNLYGFTAIDPNTGGNSDGAAPLAGLILSGNTLYGTAIKGGTNGNGTVFAVNTDGTGFTNLYSFAAGAEVGYSGYGGYYTNSDGTYPAAGLILSGNTLYGTAEYGGTNGYGTVFAINTDGTGFTNLHTFTALHNGTNSDGNQPLAGLILSGNTLYGTALYGGTNGNGTIFAINTNGSGFTNLHSFTAANYDASFNITNSDGTFPAAGLILSGNTLYGTASRGGSSGNGTVFAIKTDGTGVTNLHSFTFTALSGSYPGPYTNSDGASPQAGLILSGNTLYGTASGGGRSGVGTVFSLSLGSVSAPAPTLTIVPSGANSILTWPTNATGFTLQSTTNLVSTTVWTNVSPAAVVVNGQYAVTNPVSGTNKFYRLIQ
jgi:uncharacterized repeat protein (TIGR03803 family)